MIKTKEQVKIERAIKLIDDKLNYARGRYQVYQTQNAKRIIDLLEEIKGVLI